MDADHESFKESDATQVEPGALATLGSYRIERTLGRGGMGAVFLARDVTLQRQVALKVLESTDDQQTTRARLVREARSAAALNHPSICTIYEIGEDSGRAFIAMEYVDGRSLSEQLRHGPLPVQEALRYGIEAADALAYAHDRGVIHRDFKAANAMITTGGHLKIVDFGLAQRGDMMVAGATTIPTAVPAGAAAGTPYAMAPEQVRGEITDARTDVWALGVLLYEMVTGTKPFDAPTVPELFSAILRDAPKSWPSDVALEIRAVTERCLEKDPLQRYQKASEVRAALEKIQAGLTPIWTTWRYRVLHRRQLVTVAALLAIVAAAVGANVGGARDWLVGLSSPAPIKLAVLPFENLTGDVEQDYFSEGLTEEVITQLGRAHPQRLSVIARSSAMRYKKRDVPIQQIGRELGVAYVLEGSARREGNRVRITTALIRVADQTQLWSDTFDRELAGILTLQHDVSRGVVRALSLTLLPAEQARLRNERTVNPEAYEAYLRGLSYLERLTRADLGTALRYFESALERDPNYALAHVGVARVWGTRWQFGMTSRAEAEQGRTALARALALDDSLPEVHFALAGLATWGDWDWAAAEPSFRRAIDLNPNYADARAFYAQYLNAMRRPREALAQVERAIALDPLNPTVQTLYGNALKGAGRIEEAIAQYRSALQTAPDGASALNGLQDALFRLGRHEEAVETQRAQARARGDQEMDKVLAQGYTEGGYQVALQRAIALVDERSKTRNVNALAVAVMNMRVGDHDRALQWLERAFEARDPNLPSINNREAFDPVRSHPRFQALLEADEPAELISRVFTDTSGTSKIPAVASCP